MESVASSKYVHISPKKLREVARAIHGLAAADATDRLLVSGNKAGRMIAKTISAAVANAKQTPAMSTTNLKIKTIEIGKGPFFKRFQPVSRGMAHSIKKRTSHIKVTLEGIK